MSLSYHQVVQLISSKIVNEDEYCTLADEFSISASHNRFCLYVFMACLGADCLEEKSVLRVAHSTLATLMFFCHE